MDWRVVQSCRYTSAEKLGVDVGYTGGGASHASWTCQLIGCRQSDTGWKRWADRGRGWLLADLYLRTRSWRNDAQKELDVIVQSVWSIKGSVEMSIVVHVPQNFRAPKYLDKKVQLLWLVERVTRKAGGGRTQCHRSLSNETVASSFGKYCWPVRAGGQCQ